MTSPRYTITQQREAVEHLIGQASPVDPGIEIAARQAALTLAWIERRAELIKEIERLDREAPQLAMLLREFPGARAAIASVKGETKKEPLSR